MWYSILLKCKVYLPCMYFNYNLKTDDVIKIFISRRYYETVLCGVFWSFKYYNIYNNYYYYFIINYVVHLHCTCTLVNMYMYIVDCF